MVGSIHSELIGSRVVPNPGARWELAIPGGFDSLNPSSGRLRPLQQSLKEDS